MHIVLLFLSILPVYCLANYIYNNDSDKEPIKLVAKLFACGFGSAALTVLISSTVLYEYFPMFKQDPTALTVIKLIPYSFIGIALVEEFSKWIFVYGGTYRNKEFNHAYDAIVYATFVSLGFACIENILYVFQNYELKVAIMRAFLAVPGHACDGVFMGYFLALAKISDKNNNKKLALKNKILSLLVPVLLHGLYDYLIFASLRVQLFAIIFFNFIFIAFSKSLSLVKRMKSLQTRLDDNIDNENNQEVLSIPNQNNVSVDYNQNSQLFNDNNRVVSNYCYVCGTKAFGKFCMNCGTKIN